MISYNSRTYFKKYFQFDHKYCLKYASNFFNFKFYFKLKMKYSLYMLFSPYVFSIEFVMKFT